MGEFQTPLDLGLWLDADLIRRQNLLKSQFLTILEEVCNSFSSEDLQIRNVKSRGSKISKGNDLLGFPYQVLDLIRDFDPETGINIRLLNWVGNGFFITVLFGKNREAPIDFLLNSGFSFGLSENQWDYPDLILNQNLTCEKGKITGSVLGFSHWVKTIFVDPDPIILRQNLAEEVKKILGILRLPKE